MKTKWEDENEILKSFEKKFQTIIKEIQEIKCPIHDKTPELKIINNNIEFNTCCEELDKIIRNILILRFKREGVKSAVDFSNPKKTNQKPKADLTPSSCVADLKELSMTERHYSPVPQRVFKATQPDREELGSVFCEVIGAAGYLER